MTKAAAQDPAHRPHTHSSQSRWKRSQGKPQPNPEFFRKVRGFADETNENLRKLDTLAVSFEGNQFPLFNEWERSFIVDVAQRYELDNELSDKQLIVVYKLLKKAERWGVKF